MARKSAPESIVFFLDSSAIVHGANLPPAQCRTVPAVVGEFAPGGATHRRLELLLSGGLAVEEPSGEARQRVREAAAAGGAASRLSPVDVDILSLAWVGRERGVLVTDDYTVQDVARRLGIPIQSVATSGVETKKDWTARCAGCGRTFPPHHAGQSCPVCGSAVRLKPIR